MAHPRIYDDDDPYLRELRDVCLALPESCEVEAWGRPTFRAGKKMFGVFEGNGEHPYAVVFKPDPDEGRRCSATPASTCRLLRPERLAVVGLHHGAVDWQEMPCATGRVRSA